MYEFEVANHPLKKFEGVSAIYWKWKRANGNMPIGYNQSTIASFEPVQHFAGHEPLSIQQKTIVTSNSFEKTLLEKLIKDSLLVTGQQKLNLKRVGADLQEWKPKKIGDVLMYPAISVHVNIIDNRICIGFNMTHKFEYNYTLQQLIERGEALEEGMKIIHSSPQNNFTYEFEKIANYSVQDTCPLLKKSIYQYYVDQGDQKTAQALHGGIKVIYAKTNKQGSLSYAANLLKPLCSFETMKSHENKKVMDALKLKPDERMKLVLRQMKNLINAYLYLTFERNPFLIKHNHYEKVMIQDPILYFDKKYKKTTSWFEERATI